MKRLYLKHPGMYRFVRSFRGVCRSCKSQEQRKTSICGFRCQKQRLGTEENKFLWIPLSEAEARDRGKQVYGNSAVRSRGPGQRKTSLWEFRCQKQRLGTEENKYLWIPLSEAEARDRGKQVSVDSAVRSRDPGQRKTRLFDFLCRQL